MSQTYLNTILSRLLDAARRGDAEEVVRINESEFVPAFNRVFSRISPESHLYGQARNQCIYAVMNERQFSQEFRAQALRTAERHYASLVSLNCSTR